uniref:Uncharacterized protein n=1 Tax=Rhabditophanes sp. KR3021 TaxID=114890 RepID=A0AC35U675_9BILA
MSCREEVALPAKFTEGSKCVKEQFFYFVKINPKLAKTAITTLKNDYFKSNAKNCVKEVLGSVTSVLKHNSFAAVEITSDVGLTSSFTYLAFSTSKLLAQINMFPTKNEFVIFEKDTYMDGFIWKRVDYNDLQILTQDQLYPFSECELDVFTTPSSIVSFSSLYNTALIKFI